MPPLVAYCRTTFRLPSSHVTDMQVTSQLLRAETLPLSIVVPCFNEEVGMQELIRRCCESARAAVGEYAGRIYISTKHRPLFIIDAIERHAAE